MLAIHSSRLTHDIAETNGLECALVDAASLRAAHMQGQSRYSGCPLPAIHMISLQPAEDMSIPIFLCDVHFNGFKLGLKEGLGIDEDLTK